jgi:hypothetical protein
VRKRRRILSLGLALMLLLAGGLAAALLWPDPPSDAERLAAKIELGMTHGQLKQMKPFIQKVAEEQRKTVEKSLDVLIKSAEGEPIPQEKVNQAVETVAKASPGILGWLKELP